MIKLYAPIDTKISSLVDKINKNKNKLEDTRKGTALFFLGNSMFDWEDGFQAYLTFQPVYNILNLLPVLIIFHHGNLKDYLLKILNHLQHLIIVLLHYLSIMTTT